MSRELRTWIHNWRVDPNASCRLFCLPYAGGNANAFRPWQDSLRRSGIEVCPVELPGRLARLREPSFTSIEPLVEMLGELLRPALTRPFAFLGYSMGALIAFELVRHLRRNRLPTPLCLLLAAHRAPQLPSRGRSLHDLPDDELLAEIAKLYGAIPGSVLADPTFREIVAQIIRNDLLLLARYHHREEPPLECPIVALGGKDDPTVSAEELAAWAAQTTSFRMQLFTGGHFFLTACPEQILDEVRRTLRPFIAGTATSPRVCD